MDLARSESQQQRPQHSAHINVVVDHEETKPVEFDPNHDAIKGTGAGADSDRAYPLAVNKGLSISKRGPLRSSAIRHLAWAQGKFTRRPYL
jgi:hypothetical protein